MGLYKILANEKARSDSFLEYADGDRDMGVRTSDDGRVHGSLLQGAVVQRTMGEDIDGSATPQATFVHDGENIESSTHDASGTAQSANYQLIGTLSTYKGIGFAFTATTLNVLTRVDLGNIGQNGVGGGESLTVEIFAADGSNLPTGAALDSVNYPSTQLPGLNNIHTLSTPLVLTPGQNYCCVVTSASDSGGDFYTMSDTTTQPDTNLLNFFTVSPADVYTAVPTKYPYAVILYGYENLTIGSVYKSDETILSRNRFDGFVTETKLTGESGYVTLNGILAGFTALTIGERYFISTDGAISTTPSSQKVGAAMSVTELSIDNSKEFFQTELIYDAVQAGSQTITATKSGFYFGSYSSGGGTSPNCTLFYRPRGSDAEYEMKLTSSNNGFETNFCMPVSSGDQIRFSANSTHSITLLFKPLV